MLSKLLQQIEAGKRVNYQKLVSLLPAQFANQRQQLFRVHATGPGKWQVSIADAKLFALLKQQADAPLDRVQASEMGDSHLHQTSQSYVLVFHEQHVAAQHSQAVLRPDVVVCQSHADGVRIGCGFAAKPRLLLIENEENFFRFPAVFQMAMQMQAVPMQLASHDVALAAGSRIGSALLQPWLDGYEAIECAFDYDSAGLEIFAMLRTRLGNKVQFLVPPDLSSWQSLFRAEPKNPAQLSKAMELAEQYHLPGLAAMFRQTRRFLEQEALLRPMA